MIIGTGIDLLDAARIREVYQRHSEHFILRILTPEEQQQCADYTAGRRLEYLAGRFAMKEAVAKAMGTGIGQVVGWQDILIWNDLHGRPNVSIRPPALKKLARFSPVWQQDRWVVHVSLSHERNWMVAQAIVELRAGSDAANTT